MQEFTRIIRSIYCTGISSANCLSNLLKLEKELLKKETKASENQVSLQIRTCLSDDNVFMHLHVYACAMNYMYDKYVASESLFMSTYYVYTRKVSSRVW